MWTGKRSGRIALAVAAVAACAPSGPAPLTRGSEPQLRIAIGVDAGEVRLKGQAGMSGEHGTSLRLNAQEEVVVVPAADGVLLRDRSPQPAERVRFRSDESARFIEVNGRPYRGRIEVFSQHGSLTVVNEVALEDYLGGVVNAEMGRLAANEQAALEAQAIVSRTYALKNRGRFRADGYDLRASATDQAYLGVARETDRGLAAVRKTAGQVLTYHGDLISPFFHSTCGYSTAAPEESFRSVRSVPYLRPVSDRRPSAGYYCDISPRFRWTVEWDLDRLRDILRRTVPQTLGVDGEAVDTIRGLRVYTKGPSGRVQELRLEVGNGEIPVFGPDIRNVLLTPDGRPLGSTAFDLVVSSGADGIERVEAAGAGWGHGVGMCQWGAVGRARAGHNAVQIVTAYFPGTRVERWY